MNLLVHVKKGKVDYYHSKGKKVKKAKFKRGDMVYSYQNKKKKEPISHVSLSDDPEYDHRYKLALHDDQGYSRSSNWINEKSLSRKPIK
jgi:hypothetical protein